MSDEKPPQTVTLEVAGKPAWASKGVVGAVVAIVAMIAAGWNVQIDNQNLTEIIITAIGILGAIVALIGRIKATRPIRFVGTKPGGKFNPDAPVGKTERAGPPPSPGGRGGLNKGFARTSFLAALGLIVLGILFFPLAALAGVVTWGVGSRDAGLDAKAGAGGMTYREWIQFTPREDRRHFLVRLVDSLRWNFSATVKREAQTGDVKVGTVKAQLRGGAEF